MGELLERASCAIHSFNLFRRNDFFISERCAGRTIHSKAIINVALALVYINHAFFMLQGKRVVIGLYC